MKANYNTDETGRIQSLTTYPLDESEPIIDIPDGFDMGAASDYRIVGGALVYDPLPEPEPTPAEQVAELKKKLADTDYIVIKIAEGVATWDDYPGIREQRQEWRERIRELENEEEADE